MLNLIKTSEFSNREDDLRKIEVFDGGVNYLFIVEHYKYKSNNREFILVNLERKDWNEIEVDNYELSMRIDFESLKYNKVKIRFKDHEMNVEEIEEFIKIQLEVINFIKEVEEYLKERDMVLE